MRPGMELPFDGAISAFFENDAPREVRDAIRRADKGDVLDPSFPYSERMAKKVYEKELEHLQLDLEVLKFLFIDLLGHAFGIGKGGVEHVALVGPADGVAHLAGGVVFEKGADRAVKGELHAGPHSCGAPVWRLTPAGAIRRGSRRGGWRR